MGGKKYIVMVVDDYPRFIWVMLLKDKLEACDQGRILFKRIQNEKGYAIQHIRSDHGREFDNLSFEKLCEEAGIKQEFFSPITSKQNGVVERKNRVIQDMARAMLHGKSHATYFCREAINIACHIINRVCQRPNTKKTPYEIWKGKSPL
jgi:IS30 family transposase